MIRVVVADDHVAVREGLHSMISGQPDIEVVGEATEGGQAIALTAQLQPDLVVLDVLMSHMGGIEATRAIKAQWPSVLVLILTEFSQASIVRRALAAGADGYLLKDSSRELILSAIRTIHAGGFAASRDIGKLTHRDPPSR